MIISNIEIQSQYNSFQKYACPWPLDFQKGWWLKLYAAPKYLSSSSTPSSLIGISVSTGVSSVTFWISFAKSFGFIHVLIWPKISMQTHSKHIKFFTSSNNHTADWITWGKIWIWEILSPAKKFLISRLLYFYILRIFFNYLIFVFHNAWAKTTIGCSLDISFHLRAK